jgi:acyl carrier protein
MELFDKVRELLVEELDCEENEVSMEAHLFDDLDADSLSLMQVVVALEGEYSIRLSDEEIPNIQTVADAIRILEEKLK